MKNTLNLHDIIISYKKQKTMLYNTEKEIKRLVIADLERGLKDGDFTLLKDTIDSIPFNFIWLVPYLRKMKELNPNC